MLAPCCFVIVWFYFTILVMDGLLHFDTISGVCVCVCEGSERLRAIVKPGVT
jgi:hypothetical protein